MKYNRGKRLTQVEALIMDDIVREGGATENLMRLTDRLDLNYSYAHHCVHRMAAIGLIEVQSQGRAKALVLRVAGTPDGREGR